MVNRQRFQASILPILIALALFAAADSALAVTAGPGVLDNVRDTFQAATLTWVASIKSAAVSLYWILVGVDFAWFGYLRVKETSEMQDLVMSLVNKILTYGFFYYVIDQAPTWMTAITSSFVQVAAGAVGSSAASATSPSSVIDQGLALVSAIDKQTSIPLSLTGLGTLILMGWINLVIIFSFAVAAGQLLITQIETYIASSAAIIMLGFGGSKWTLDYVQKVFGYVMGAGLKLFVITLIIGTAQPLFSSVISTVTSGSGNMDLVAAAPLVAVAVVFMFLCFQVPSLASAIMSGTPSMTLGSAAATVATVGAAGVGAVGMGVAAMPAALGAGRAAGAVGGAVSALVGGGSGGGAAGLGGALANAPAAFQNIKSAMGESLGSGVGSSFGSMGKESTGGRFAESLSQKTALADAAAAPTSGPSDSGAAPASSSPVSSPSTDGGSTASAAPGGGSMGSGTSSAPTDTSSAPATSPGGNTSGAPAAAPSPASAPSDTGAASAPSAPASSPSASPSTPTETGGGSTASAAPAGKGQSFSDILNQHAKNPIPHDHATGSAPTITINHAE